MSRLDPPTYLQHIRAESQRFRDVLAACSPTACACGSSDTPLIVINAMTSPFTHPPALNRP